MYLSAESIADPGAKVPLASKLWDYFFSAVTEPTDVVSVACRLAKMHWAVRFDSEKLYPERISAHQTEVTEARKFLIFYKYT